MIGLTTDTVQITPAENLAEVMSACKSGTNIVLCEGNYPLLRLVGKDSFPDNISITAETDAIVSISGVSVTSGMNAWADIQNHGDISGATMHSGLTFRGIKFTSAVSIRNCCIDGLTIENCHFDSGGINIVANRTDDEYGNDGSATFNTIPDYATRYASNVVIRNCTFGNILGNNAYGTYRSAIYIATVRGCVIDSNNIQYADFNGIQIQGTAGTKYDAKSTGKIAITNNTIKGSGSRSIRLNNFEYADIYVINNKLHSSDMLEENEEQIKLSSYDSTCDVRFRDNMYENSAITEGSGILATINETATETKLTEHMNDMYAHSTIMSTFVTHETLQQELEMWGNIHGAYIETYPTYVRSTGPLTEFWMQAGCELSPGDEGNLVQLDTPATNVRDVFLSVNPHISGIGYTYDIIPSSQTGNGYDIINVEIRCPSLTEHTWFNISIYGVAY